MRRILGCRPFWPADPRVQARIAEQDFTACTTATRRSMQRDAAEKLLRELHGMTDPQSLKYRVLESYQLLATKQKANVDRAMHNFIEILETEKDYLPALLGMSTAFMLENSTTKARNALKRIQTGEYAKMFINEGNSNYPSMTARRRLNAEHPIEQVGEKLRGMMPWIKANQIVDKSKN